MPANDTRIRDRVRRRQQRVRELRDTIAALEDDVRDLELQIQANLARLAMEGEDDTSFVTVDSGHPVWRVSSRPGLRSANLGGVSSRSRSGIVSPLAGPRASSRRSRASTSNTVSNTVSRTASRAPSGSTRRVASSRSS